MEQLDKIRGQDLLANDDDRLLNQFRVPMAVFSELCADNNKTIYCLCLLVTTTMGFLTTGTFQMGAGTSIGAVPVDPAAKPLQPCWMESSACQPGLSDSRTLQPIRTRLKHNLQSKADFQMSYYSIASATTTSTTTTMSIFTPTGSIFTQSLADHLINLRVN